MGEIMFVKLQCTQETWVQVSRIALVQAAPVDDRIDLPTNDGCDIHVLNGVGWTVIRSHETVEAFMDRIRVGSALGTTLN